MCAKGPGRVTGNWELEAKFLQISQQGLEARTLLLLRCGPAEAVLLLQNNLLAYHRLL